MPPPSEPSRPVGTDGTVFKCPMCKTILPTSNVPSFPFCSDRCRLRDLGNWLDGKYSVSRPIDPTDHLDDMPQGPTPDPPTPPTRGV